MSGYTVVPAIEDVLGQPQQPLADLYNRPRNAGPNFHGFLGPIITSERTTMGEENEPPEPPTRPATPNVHPFNLHDPLLGIDDMSSIALLITTSLSSDLSSVMSSVSSLWLLESVQR
ncbi:hypothetical protein JTE90_020602 [Oedothorax gibbosus]|uniref:Uncharacterized protein n=1 Tax=Oedothorax gibbosus TaxID=931172 RepID=A0AAV6TS51_9ARAC|nr:hypothetical protein JTE90_020602 [Oedothorax gibbosus]